MKILGIDPGPIESAYVIFDSENNNIDQFGILENKEMLSFIQRKSSLLLSSPIMAIEVIKGFGIPAGETLFETCEWIGLFRAPYIFSGKITHRIGRKDVIRHFCGHTKGGDSALREALIHRFGEPGTKKTPGKLYGIKSHCWSALGLSVFCGDVICVFAERTNQKGK